MRLLLILISTLMSGCMNMGVFQTAETVPKGEFRYHVAGGFHDSSGINSQVPDGQKRSNDVTLDGWFMEVGVRAGLSDNIDLAVRISPSHYYLFEGKYNYIKNGPWREATGAGIGYYTSKKFQFVDFVAPYYISYMYNSWIDIYLSPRFVLRSIQMSETNSTLLIAGAGLGTKLGKDEGAMVELLGYQGMDQRSYKVVQIGFGFFF